ncbi:MAG TPA: DNA adenine methylase [Nitrolancea sp.]|nr:DNA adenine methylase [Nitrolancea sp.]
MGESYREVAPLAGAAPYYGGKKLLAARIIARIEKIPHLCYAEPFLGMGGVFFRRRKAPPAEVINDGSRDVATFFRVLQRHYLAFIEMLRWQITTRSEFQRLVATNPDTLTDLERAARFFYLQRTGFGGKVVGRTFGTSALRGGAFDISRIVPHLEDLHSRLAGVTIECLPYSEFIARYDRPSTLFYLDPPYVGMEKLYEGGFTREDFGRLEAQLSSIQGRFIMSLNDSAEVRRLFAKFRLATVETTYTAGGPSHVKRVTELLISSRPRHH